MKFLSLIFILVVSANALAEDVFYNENIRIKSVDCDKGEVVTSSQKTFTLRQLFPSNPKAPVKMCARLSAFAGQDNSITLLTVPTEKSGDLVTKQEAIGFVDIDYIVAAWDYSKLNKVFKGLCGNESRSTHVCVWTADDKRKFLSFESLNGTVFYSATEDKDGNLTAKDESNEQAVTYQLKISSPSTGDTPTFVGSLEVNGEVNYPPFQLFDSRVKKSSGPRF